MYDPEQITFFAKTDARGQQVPFGIKANDRTRHVYVIGKTGMGKSTLLENMAVQDLKNGNGLAFIDPHGQTAETLLEYIPEERKDDVVYFAPFDTEYPVSFNVMEDVGPEKRHLVVSGLMSVFKKVFVDAWSARMEYILSNTLMALLEYPDATLLGVNRMLSDKDYRMRVIENVTDPAVKSFWVDEFLKYNERYMQEAGDSIKNKIGQFTGNPLIRNIIGQPHSSFDIRKIMDEKKILIMNLSKGLVGESNANLLGSMLTTRIYLAAMSRADLSPAELKAMPNFYFYVDEFQSFANATFADILSEARKYKLNLTIAHQYVAQMEDEVRDAVFGNVGTIISFRVGPFDAEVLETVYTPKFLAPDIVNLGFAQIYLTLMIDGIGSAPFSATTLPPIDTEGRSFRDDVIAHSRALYAKPKAGVEEVIHAWHAKSFSDKPVYIPKHLREKADGGDLPNTGENKKKYGEDGVAPKDQQKTSVEADVSPGAEKKGGQPGNGAPHDNGTHNGTSRNGGGQGRPSGGSGDSGGNGSHSAPRLANGDRAGSTYNKSSTPREPARNGNGGNGPDAATGGRPSQNNGRPSQNGNGSPQNAGRPEQKGKSVDELRSVLKNIANGNEKDKEVASEKKEAKKQEDLKGALAAALGSVAGAAVEQKQEEKKADEVQHTLKEENKVTDSQRSQPKAVDTSVLVKPKEEVTPVVAVGTSEGAPADRPQGAHKEAQNAADTTDSGNDQASTSQEHGELHNARNGDETGNGKKRKRRRKKKGSSGGDVHATTAGGDTAQEAARQPQQHKASTKNTHPQTVHEAATSQSVVKNDRVEKAQHYDARAMQSEEKTEDKSPVQTVEEQAPAPAPQQAVQAPSVMEQPAVEESKAPAVEPQVVAPPQAPVAAAAPQAAVSVPPTPVSTERTAFSQNNEYALIKNKATVDPLAPKKLERMMKVTTSDKLPLK